MQQVAAPACSNLRGGGAKLKGLKPGEKLAAMKAKGLEMKNQAPQPTPV